jgi:hypothetical protein
LAFLLIGAEWTSTETPIEVWSGCRRMSLPISRSSPAFTVIKVREMDGKPTWKKK